MNPEATGNPQRRTDWVKSVRGRRGSATVLECVEVQLNPFLSQMRPKAFEQSNKPTHISPLEIVLWVIFLFLRCSRKHRLRRNQDLVTQGLVFHTTLTRLWSHSHLNLLKVYDARRPTHGCFCVWKTCFVAGSSQAQAQPLSGSPRDTVFSSPRPVFFSSFRNIVFSFKLLLRPLTVDFNLQRRTFMAVRSCFTRPPTHTQIHLLSHLLLSSVFFIRTLTYTQYAWIQTSFLHLSFIMETSQRQEKKKDSNWNVEEFCLKWISTCICS